MVRFIAAVGRSAAFPCIGGKRIDADPRSLVCVGNTSRYDPYDTLGGSHGVVVGDVGSAPLEHVKQRRLPKVR